MSPDYVSYIMLGVSVIYMIYFIVKIRLQERKDFTLMDEEFLLEKDDKRIDNKLD